MLPTAVVAAVALMMPTSKGMNRVALVELGSGCCHSDDSTKAAIRACNDAIEWNSVKVRTIIPGGYDGMQLHVQIGVPNPENVDVGRVAACFPYGNLLPIVIESGGLLGSSRAGLPSDEPREGLMTVANACVTVGYSVEGNNGEEAPTPAADRREPASSLLSPPPPPPSPSPLPRTPSAPTTFLSPLGELDGAAGVSSTDAADDRTDEERALAKRLSERILTPYEAFAMLGEEEGDVELFDVRPSTALSDLGGMSVKGAKALPVDALLRGEVPLPASDLAAVVLVCPRGSPYSLRALDFLAEACPTAVCVEGGVVAWEEYKLPVGRLGET